MHVTTFILKIFFLLSAILTVIPNTATAATISISTTPADLNNLVFSYNQINPTVEAFTTIEDEVVTTRIPIGPEITILTTNLETLRNRYSPFYGHAIADEVSEKYAEKVASDNLQNYTQLPAVTPTDYPGMTARFLLIANAHLDKGEAEKLLVTTQKNLLFLAEVELTMAKIGKLLASTPTQKATADSRVSLALSNITERKSDLEGTLRSAQRAALDAQSNATLADVNADLYIGPLETTKNTAKSALDDANWQLDPSRIGFLTDSQRSYWEGQRSLRLIAYNTALSNYTSAANLRDDPNTGTKAVVLRATTLAADVLELKPSVDSAIEIAGQIIEKTEKEGYSVDFSQGNTQSQGEISGLGDNISSAVAAAGGAGLSPGNIWVPAGEEEDSGQSFHFNPRQFLAQASAPCAATAAAAYLVPKIVSRIKSTIEKVKSIRAVPISSTGTVIEVAAQAQKTGYTADFLDCIIYTMGQLMVENITTDIVIWIQGGFQGKPRFATNLNSVLDGAEDIPGGDLVRELRGIATCRFDVFFVDDLGLEQMSRKKHRNMFTDKVSCPFDESLGGFSTQSFYNDFGSGGWKAFEKGLNDNGNPYGVKVLASKEAQERMAANVEQEKTRLSWSGGFADILDPTKCDYPSDVATRIRKTENNSVGPGNKDYLDPATIKAYKKQYCDTTTPGSVIEGQLAKVTTNDIERLGLADSLNKIVHTLISTLSRNAVKSAFGRASGS